MSDDGLAGFREWLRHRGYRESVVRSYPAIVRRWLASSMSGSDWLRAELERSRPAGGGYPTRSASVYRKALAAYFESTGRDAGELTLPRVHRYRQPRQQHALTVDQDAQLQLLIPALPQPVRTLVTLLRDLGLRVEEACSLRLADLIVRHPLGPHLVLRNTKTVAEAAGDAPDRVPLPVATLQHLRDYLTDWRAVQPGPWMFPGTRAHITQRTVRRHLDAIGQRLGTRITPHTLRHTLATRMGEAGVPAAHIQAALRHSDPRSTTRYNHHLAFTDAVTAALTQGAINRRE